MVWYRSGDVICAGPISRARELTQDAPAVTSAARYQTTIDALSHWLWNVAPANRSSHVNEGDLHDHASTPCFKH